ncbi:MAG: cytochrome c3 family protein [Gemmatimonadaceae bacterium]|nr:cytochrome c3 family protein [Gemmatimonadaceae bacterium]
MKRAFSKLAGLTGRSRLFWLLATGLVVAAMVPVSRVVARQAAPRFSHEKHQKLFPQCSGCHAGIPTGTLATSFPDTATCGECHNNRDRKKVEWSGPTRAASNLRFTHVDHLGLTDAEGAACITCHATPDAKWMQVDRAKPAQCLACHTHRASAHLAADNRCASCHVPLTQAKTLSVARIAAFPKPPSHDQADFARRHDATGALAQAQCAVCHARESCARCHVNATRIATVYRLASDTRVAGLVAGKPASYTAPTSHRGAGFLETHGPMAREFALTCANCHAQASCQACHTGKTAADVIALLPVAERGDAAGVQIKTNVMPWNGLTEATTLTGRIALGPATNVQKAVTGAEPRKAQVHAPGFSRTHGASAASSQLNCEGCHSKSYCADCHGGESKRRFHVANFAARHAPEAWGRETDCQQCHNPEVFCRACHVQVGLSAKGRTNVGYHSAVPLWTLQHGQAARQGLQTCTSCHTQKDCMQCHAQGGRGINPHGANFDAKRMWKANRLTCLRCHFKDPFEGR